VDRLPGHGDGARIASLPRRATHRLPGLPPVALKVSSFSLRVVHGAGTPWLDSQSIPAPGSWAGCARWDLCCAIHTTCEWLAAVANAVACWLR
jgi:hypothetical protein